MTYILRVYEQMEVGIGSDTFKCGSRSAPKEVTLTNGIVFDVKTQIAVNGMWSAWDSTQTPTQWDVLFISSDQDIYVEFLAGSVTFAKAVTSGFPLILSQRSTGQGAYTGYNTSDMTGGAETAISRIRIYNRSTNSTSANVRMVLFH